MTALPAPFEPFPVLETPRLVLRRIGPDDEEALFRIHSDPRTFRYFGRPGDTTREAVRERFGRSEAALLAGEGIRWAFTRKIPGNPVVGTGGLWRWNKPHFHAEVGYEIDPEHWGQGLMPEALRAICQFGFDVMGLHRVVANIDPKNKASARALEKTGFLLEGTQREDWYHDGQFTDTGVYGLLRRDFEVLRAS